MPIRKSLAAADAGLRHAVRVSKGPKADAGFAQAQALKSSKVYAHTDIRDLQGLANACLVNGFAR
jgi:hypothetical protein